MQASSQEGSPVELGAGVAGLAANGIVAWSLATKWQTGAGLQGDVLGGIEGISYLVVLAILGWSIKTKASTGSGLPAGPAGLLGAAEGLTFLSVLAAVVVFGRDLIPQ